MLLLKSCLGFCGWVWYSGLDLRPQPLFLPPCSSSCCRCSAYLEVSTSGLLPGVLQSELLPGIQPRGCAPEGLDKACTVGSPAGREKGDSRHLAKVPRVQKGDSRSPCPSWPARRSPVLLNLNFHSPWAVCFDFLGNLFCPIVHGVDPAPSSFEGDLLMSCCL